MFTSYMQIMLLFAGSGPLFVCVLFTHIAALENGLDLGITYCKRSERNIGANIVVEKGDVGYIASFGYPNNYTTDVYHGHLCNVELQACSTCKIRLKFVELRFPDCVAQQTKIVNQIRSVCVEGCDHIRLFEVDQPYHRTTQKNYFSDAEGSYYDTISSVVVIQHCMSNTTSDPGKRFYIQYEVIDKTEKITGTVTSPMYSVTSGTITSPNFPHGYALNGEIYTYMIQNLDPYGHVQLVFDDWDLAEKSHIQVYDDLSGPTRATIYGRRKRPTILSNTNTMVLVFNVGNDPYACCNHIGFKATYTFVSDDTWTKRPRTDCSDSFQLRTGGIIEFKAEDDEIPQWYDCVWTIKRYIANYPDGVILRLDEVSLGQGWLQEGINTLEVFEGITSMGGELARYTSHNFSAGEMVYSSGDGLYIRLRGIFNKADRLKMVFTGVNNITATGCPVSAEFQCDNAWCIDKDLTCDGVDHCGDNSDENPFLTCAEPVEGWLNSDSNWFRSQFPTIQFATHRSSKTCQAPEAPRNGHVASSIFDDGSGEAEFWCDPGFKLVGAKTLRCESRKRRWEGAGVFPSCRSQQTVEDFAAILKDDFFDPLASSTSDADGNDVHGKLSVGKTGLDIVLMVDISASIGEKSLQTSKDFLKLIVDQFGVSPDPTGGTNGTRVALITFDSKAEIIFNVDDKNIRSTDAVNKKIDEIKQTGGGTNLKDALGKAAQIALNTLKLEKKRYAHSTRAVFILTDAEATFTDSASLDMFFINGFLRTLNIENFEIFAIGVGKKVDQEMLETIASKPTDEHVFVTDDFKDLNRVRDIIAEKNIDYGQCGISGNFKADSGSESTQGSWPWLGWLGVMMQQNETTGSPDASFTCGGALLCDRWFLTVAHCVSFVGADGLPHPANTHMVNLNLGDHNIYNVKDNNHIITGVKNILLHPNYTGEKTEHGVRKYDVALLDLGEETFAPLNKFIRPLCFPTEVNKGNDSSVYGISAAMLESMLKGDHKAYVAGWGHAPINADLAKLPWEVLSQDKRRLQENKRCLKRFPGLDTDMFFCVFNSVGESEVCRGDIGGPFMDEMSNNRFTVLGLAAKTHDCQEQVGFSLFLNVINPAISDWVGEHLDGCNRVKEEPDWAIKMQEKREAIAEKRRKAEEEKIKAEKERKALEEKRKEKARKARLEAKEKARLEADKENDDDDDSVANQEDNAGDGKVEKPKPGGNKKKCRKGKKNRKNCKKNRNKDRNQRNNN